LTHPSARSHPSRSLVRARAALALAAPLLLGRAGAAQVPPAPDEQVIEEGATASFSAPADAKDPVSWLHDGVPIEAAGESTLLVAGAGSESAGTYACRDAAGAVTETRLRVVRAAHPGHLSKVWCRTYSGSGDRRLSAGFVVGGGPSGPAVQVLVRAAGPSLASKGVEHPLPDPTLVLKRSGETVRFNRGWAGDPGVSAIADSVGASEWDPASLDSALVETLRNGAYTAEIFSTSGERGIALAEVYDARDPDTFGKGMSRLTNVSARSPVGKAPNLLILGFTVAGQTSLTVLVRGAGPALAAFGIPGLLPDPSLLLYRENEDGSTTWIRTNAGWRADRTLARAAEAVGAFSWGAAPTADAAILAMLRPGRYAVLLSGASGSTGVGLAEVYEVP
jgi:hypothetical protein